MKEEHIHLATGKKYQENNWLLDKKELIDKFPGVTLVELGCGNGKFVKACWPRWAAVGVDFVRSPVLEDIPFIEADLRYFYNWYGACVSSDVLEHLMPEDIAQTIDNINHIAPSGFHQIACYDAPGHHCVRPPKWWIDAFSKTHYKHHETIERRKGKFVVSFIKEG